MKTRAIIVVILTVTSLNFQGCGNSETVNDLFYGVIPRLEVVQEDSIHVTSPGSLFLTLTNGAVELDGVAYPIEKLEEDEQQIVFSVSLPLDEYVKGRRITYLKQDRELILELDIPQMTISMEPFQRMIERKVSEYVEVDLQADVSGLSDNQRSLLTILFQVADIMNDIYWQQVFPDRDMAMNAMVNEHVKRLFMINYGPWERLSGNLPYLPGYGPKPAGSGFYPPDMSKEEFEKLEDPDKADLYTLVTRDPGGSLKVVPYHEAFASRVEKAASLMRQAAELAEDESFGNYLRLRADALLTDDYFASDIAWMEMKENDIDFVVGPIENYEDALFNYKAAHESFVLIKDKEWSERLAFIASVLPEMQKELPVDAAYKQEVPGSGSDLGAYDVIYYAGDCNAGSKTIAINLPNDERVHAAKGSRKLQLKNAIRYKFEEILVPISNVLIAEDQREHVTFDAFFENIMFHEVAHGLGINYTLNGKGTVRSALMEQSSALEEGKADILSLFLITTMYEKGMLEKEDLMDNYITFMASIFRSIRFGVASSHGKANMVRFYYFQEEGAFTRDARTGTYRVDFEKMKEAMNSLASMILTIQGNGDYEAARRLVDEKGFIREELQADLGRLKELSIPVDLVFNQGPGLLGL